MSADAMDRFKYQPRQIGFEKECLSPEKNISLEIKKIFSNQLINRSDFDKFIAENLARCNVSDIAVIMRMSGKKSMNSNHNHLKNHLQAIASKLDTLSFSSSSLLWLPNYSAQIMYGLQCLRESDPGTLNIITTVAKIMTESLERDEQMSPQNIGMLLLGLQNKDSFVVSVKSSTGSEISVDVDSVSANALTITTAVAVTGCTVAVVGF